MVVGRMLGGPEVGAHGLGIFPLIKGDVPLGSNVATEEEEEML
jgi:hypothetical protein